MRKTTIAMALTAMITASVGTAVWASDEIEFAPTGIYAENIASQMVGGFGVSKAAKPSDTFMGYVEAIEVPNLALAKQTDENFKLLADEINKLKNQPAQSAGSWTVVSVDDNLDVVPIGKTNDSTEQEIGLQVNPDLKLNSITIDDADADNPKGIFIGDNADAYFTKEAISVGDFSYDSTTRNMRLGGGKLLEVKAGEVSQHSTDAVNGSQLWATQQMIDRNAAGIRDMQHQINEVDDNVKKSGAQSAALAALHPQDYNEDHPFSAAAGVGHYDGESAVAVGMYMRPTENFLVGLGAAAVGNDDVMMNLGVSYRFGGSKSYASLSQSDINRKVVALSTQNDALRAQLECANERSDASAERVAKMSQELEAMKVKMKAIEALLAKKH